MPGPGVLAPAFPAPFTNNYKSLRFYATGTATANFVDNEFSFERPDPKDAAEPEQGYCHGIRVRATSGNIEFSFDGVNVHGFVPAGQAQDYQDRHEGGIAVRGGGTFHVEAW